MTTLYNYFDYREFLNAWFHEHKKVGAKVSLQSISEKAGFSSKSYLHRIITGKAPLSLKSSTSLGEALELSSDEITYFKLLIQFKHAKNDFERMQFLQEIEHRANTQAYTLEKRKFDYFSKWYIPVVREVATTMDFQDDYQKLGRTLTPVISAKEAREAIQTLLELKLLSKEENRYIQTDAFITAQDDLASLALRSHQRTMIEMGRDAIERFDKEERNVLSITAGISKEGYTALNKATEEFQKKVLNIVNQHPSIELSCQLNTQLFPLTKHFDSKGVHYED
ncbi:MAG: TIGR02147 family protein [Fibrobacterales bacterium]